VSLNSFQINQEKLVRMLGNIQAMTLMGWRLCKLYDNENMTPGHASLTKACELNCNNRSIQDLARISYVAEHFLRVLTGLCLCIGMEYLESKGGSVFGTRIAWWQWNLD
jgi:hypothetical protein